MGDNASPASIRALSVVVLGASGDLAKKKTFPALFTLFARGFLPADTRIIGFARSELTDDGLRQRIAGNLKADDAKRDEFLSLLTFCQGSYTEPEGFQELQRRLEAREQEVGGDVPIGRMYYLALPPSVYGSVVKGLKENADLHHPNPKSWLRVVVEKPFGKDLESSEALAEDVAKYLPEEQVYRIDHYLGKELTQNLTILRFANAVIEPSWNRHFISNVQICFKEPFGTEGRGGYFDEFGIIRDVIQNHLMQVMALMAMEKPVSLSAEDIRDEKVKVLRACSPVTVDDAVLGQYTAGAGMEGYLQDKGVPKDSITPTFALCVLHVNNDRWQGVPFMLKAGKALNERKVEIRVQYKPPVRLPGSHVDLEHMRNELVMRCGLSLLSAEGGGVEHLAGLQVAHAIWAASGSAAAFKPPGVLLLPSPPVMRPSRLQPNEAVYLKLAVKQPGLEMTPIMSELDLSFKDRYQDSIIPEAYERLLLDAINGNQQHFVRRDELKAAWKIFTPLLHTLEEQRIKPHPYEAGTRGPPQSDELVKRQGFRKNMQYQWGGRKSLEQPRM